MGLQWRGANRAVQEHDRIEQEIEDYMGDLARLKAFAESAYSARQLARANSIYECRSFQDQPF